MDLLAGMEFDLFIPSLPELQSHFHLSAFMVEMLLSANFIGYCLSLFLVGEFADRYSRKKVIFISLIVFIFGSLFCLWFESYSLLLVGRFLQGIGIAAPAILSFLIITDLYPLKEQQRLMAMLNGVMNISVAIAPIIGSYLTLYFHWQGNFITLLGLGLLVWLTTIFFIPANQPLKTETPFPLTGYITIFKSKPLILLIFHIILMIIPYWIFVGISPLLYIKDLGVKLSQFGYYQGSFALVFALGCFIFGFIIKKFRRQKKMLVIANQVFILSFICLVITTYLNSTTPLIITLAFMPYVIGQIIPSTILYPACLNYKPEAKARVAALIQGGRLILSALILQLTGYCYQNSFQNVGVMISGCIFFVIITLHFVIKNKQIMECL
jgi:DHA1 family bicyclomycin/chloramphenicol resistance-like MFS transporter